MIVALYPNILFSATEATLVIEACQSASESSIQREHFPQIDYSNTWGDLQSAVGELDSDDFKILMFPLNFKLVRNVRILRDALIDVYN